MAVIHPPAPALPSGTHTLINTLTLSPAMHISCSSVRQMRDTLRVIIILIQFSVLPLTATHTRSQVTLATVCSHKWKQGGNSSLLTVKTIPRMLLFPLIIFPSDKLLVASKNGKIEGKLEENRAESEFLCQENDQ